MTTRAKPKRLTKAEKRSQAEAQAKRAARELLNVQMSGAILRSVAEHIAAGKTGTPLRNVLIDAEEICRQAAWREQIKAIVGGM